MSKTNHLVLAAAAMLGLASLAIQGCSRGPVTAPTIVAFGPKNVKAGVMFDKQSNGQAAMWVKASDDLLPNAVIVFNGTQLVTHPHGKVATAFLPAELYAKAGSYPLQIKEKDGTRELQSAVVQFVVK